MRSIVYHQVERFFIHTIGVMRYKCDLSHLMIYTLLRDYMPSLSARIKNPRSSERGFLGTDTQNGTGLKT